MYVKLLFGLYVVGMLLPLTAFAGNNDLDKISVAETQNEAGIQQSIIADAPGLNADQPTVLVAETPAMDEKPLSDSANEPAALVVDVPSNATAEASEDEPDEAEIYDPLEPFNRAMFTFNDKLYFWVLKPVSTGYNKVMPEQARVSVRNLYTNASMPMRFLGSLMQGKFTAAGTELARFTINTTLGIAGLFDVAEDHFGLQPHMEDLGQTLGLYGIGNGPYLVLPFLGPSTFRDTLGLAGDTLVYPLGYIEPIEALVGVIAYDKINRVSLSVGEYDSWKNSTLDLYTSMKDAYVKRRSVLIKE